MRLAVLFGSLFIGLPLSLAKAADVSIRSSLIQSIEANSNYQLLSRAPGITFVPVSTVVVDALARTPTMRFALNVDLSYRSFFGPGADTQNLVPGLDRGFRGSFEKYANLATYRIDGGTRTTQANQLQLAETGRSTVSGDTTTSWVEGGVRQQLGYNDLLALSAIATFSQFTDPNLPDFLNLVATGTWTHRINPLIDLTPMIQYEAVSRDGTAALRPSDTTIWRGTLGINSKITKRLSVSGALGVAMVNAPQNVGGSSLPLISQPLTSGSALDWIGNLQVSYSLTPRDTFSLFASKSISPDSFSVLREFDVIGAALSHRFNSRSSLTVAADYSHQPSRAGATDLYSSSVTLDHQLAREWFTSLSYRYRHRTDEIIDDDAKSHAMYFSIRRDFTILPSSGGEPAPAAQTEISRVLAFPNAWISPWRNATWWQRP